MSEAAYIPERWPLIFDFFLLFIIAFTLDTDPNPVPALEPEPEPYLVTHSVSCSAKAKSYGSIGSGSGATTLADSNWQWHWLTDTTFIVKILAFAAFSYKIKKCKKSVFRSLFGYKSEQTQSPSTMRQPMLD
jgi:hypothetical protein